MERGRLASSGTEPRPPNAQTRVREKRYVRPRLAWLIEVIDNAPPSPPAESDAGPSRASGTAYYRPSMDRLMAMLRKKAAFVAREEQFEMFDHLVRGLGRDGLLASGTELELVRRACMLRVGSR